MHKANDNGYNQNKPIGTRGYVILKHRNGFSASKIKHFVSSPRPDVISLAPGGFFFNTSIQPLGTLHLALLWLQNFCLLVFL